MDNTTLPELTQVALEQPRWRTLHFAVLALVVAVWFGSLELRGLFAPDEGRYAEIPREMLAAGDWITPRLNDLKYFEKPPLQYWMTALSFRLFGEDEWTARLPAAMAGFFAMLLVGYTGYRLWGMRTGALAATVLLSSWGYFLAGQFLTLDMTLTGCLALSLCSFLLANTEQDVSRSKRWMLAAWTGMALAVMAKGLVGILLPGLTLLAYLALTRDPVLLKRLNPVAGGALFLLITLPWFVAVQIRNPEFFNFFFIREHFQRFLETEHHRPGAWWYYVPIMIVGLLPWTPALIKEAFDWYRERRIRASGFSPTLFCAVWAGTIVLFFSASQSKLPAYILPALPAVALVLAKRIQNRQQSLQWSAWGFAGLGIVTLVAVSMLPGFSKVQALGSDALDHIPWLYAAAGILIVAGVGAVWVLRGKKQFAAIALLVAGTVGSWNVVFGFLHALDANFSSERLIESLTGNRKPFRPELPFYSLAQFDPSVPFYLGRTVTLVDTRGELGSGIDAEPHKAIPTLDGFENVWRGIEGQAYAIMRPDTLIYLQQRRLPMIELRSDIRFVVVGRRAESYQQVH